MKRFLSTFALVLAAAFSLHAQTAPDAAVLTKLLNDFLAGAGRNDAAMHDRFWDDDLIYTRSVGVRTNKEELMKGVRSAPAAKPGNPVTVYTAEDIQIHQYGNAAVVAFRLVSTTTKPDGTKTVGNNLNTGTFIKRKDGWRAVAWQSTVVPKSAETPAKAEMALTTEKPLTNSPVPLLTPKTESSSASTPGDRVYQKGTRGGCYYLGTGGKKVYVDHKYCS